MPFPYRAPHPWHSMVGMLEPLGIHPSRQLVLLGLEQLQQQAPEGERVLCRLERLDRPDLGFLGA